MIEAWEVDNHGRNKIAGYTLLNIPLQSGTHKIESYCWRPKPSYSEKIIGALPELEYKDMLLASQSRAGFATETTGSIVTEVNVVLVGFEMHGVKM